jgi:hypothetical protein
MDKVDINFLQEIIILENLKKIDLRVMESIFGKMEMCIKDNGKII